MRHILFLGALSCGPAPALSETVRQSFADCSAQELKFLAARHAVQLAFEPCGTNGFLDAAWSTDGRRLVFRLSTGLFLMEADRPTRDVARLPIDDATDGAVWLSPDRLVVPVGVAGGAPRLAVWDHPAPTADGPLTTGALRHVPWTGPPGELHDLAAAGPGAALTTLRSPDGAHAAYTIDLATGATAPLPTTLPPFETLSWRPPLRRAVLGSPDGVALIDLDSGAVLQLWPDARAGALDASGTWLVLERDGQKASAYLQHTWDELSATARERSIEEERQRAASRPGWSNLELTPPVLDFVELSTGRRWTAEGFLGDQAAWYDAAPGWLTFRLWGFEGKQVKPNVALVDLGSRLRALQQGAPTYAFRAQHGPAEDR